MTPTEIEERFGRTDQLLDLMDERLRRIAQQNAHLGEMVEVLAGYVNTAIEFTQEHIADPGAHEG